MELIPCSDLAVEMTTSEGGSSTIEECRTVLDGDTFYFLDDMTAEELLVAVDRELVLGLGERRREQTLEIGRRRNEDQASRRVRRAATVEEKLLELAGEDGLRALVPGEAVRLAELRRGRRMAPAEVAAMATGAQGSQLLKKLSPIMQDRGMTVPARFAGGNAAIDFVEQLGLPVEYAGTKQSERPEFETIAGPLQLPPLHSYQAKTVRRIRAMLASAEGKNRGLVSLPTGSGKTRVVVQAVIDHIREVEPGALVVWIAQSDELCEQAVETWRYLWRAIGPDRTELTLNRLWGGNSALRVPDTPQVVVAIDDKLTSLAHRKTHEWLREASIVVVDEAHTSISKTYTGLFNWLGRSHRERTRPVLGLSATPFRGHDEEQTRRLVNRYDDNLLTDDLFGGRDPHSALQEMGILAGVRHQLLDGMDISLGASPTPTDDKLSLLESRIDMREVASDTARNERILSSLFALPGDTTALVFAASIMHAEQLAAVLQVEGVPARAISSTTPPADRRTWIEKFRQGDIRVLTNYNVLSQGFDAPRVGAVYVARPTFSPNRYQQMIGRGLRGPLNGGSEEVLIVNVRDNVDAYGEQLAFHHFDHLWRTSLSLQLDSRTTRSGRGRTIPPRARHRWGRTGKNGGRRSSR